MAPYVTSFVFLSCFRVRVPSPCQVRMRLFIYFTLPVNVMKSELSLRAPPLGLRIPRCSRSSDHSCAFVVVKVVVERNDKLLFLKGNGGLRALPVSGNTIFL
jgi:hypothetical protein